MKLFKREQEVLAVLLDQWYAEIKQFTEHANGIFTDKARQYDRSSPVWERIAWPRGFVQELRKKTDRVSQLLDRDNPNWDDVNEELTDIMNYARMFGAINDMVRAESRNGEV